MRETQQHPHYMKKRDDLCRERCLNGEEKWRSVLGGVVKLGTIIAIGVFLLLRNIFYLLIIQLTSSSD